MLNLVVQFSAAASEPAQLGGLSALETKRLSLSQNGFVLQRWEWKAPPNILGFSDFLKLKQHKVWGYSKLKRLFYFC